MQFPLISRLAKSVNIYRTREEYFQKTGKKAQDFDWSRPMKNWEDTREFADAEEEVEYLGVAYDPNGKPIEEMPGVVKLKRFRLYPEVATTVNLIPSPFPPDASLTMAQRAMAKRAIPEPLELLEGEKVVISRNLGSEPVVDDGKPSAVLVGAGGGGFTDEDRRTLKTILSTLLSFQSPPQK
jgi:hypothetical protein